MVGYISMKWLHQSTSAPKYFSSKATSNLSLYSSLLNSLNPNKEHTMVGPSPCQSLKFLCSYGGKILPRYPDGKLRYLGGHTRLLSLPRFASFSEVMVKLTELCGSHVTHLRCQLPNEDLDALVSITSHEDLTNLIEEYDRVSCFKIRAFLFCPPTLSSTSSTSSFCCHTVLHMSPATPVNKSSVYLPCPRFYGNRGAVYLIRNGKHWY